MICMTVGLPLYNSKYIAPLAMQSLARQQGLFRPDDEIEWELVVVEEQNDLMFGERAVMSYAESLDDAGCARVHYIPLEGWVPLSFKWAKVAQAASPTSGVMILQAGDCYSSPLRLRSTYNAFIESDAQIDWLDSDWGIFYYIPDGQMALYSRKDARGRTGMDIAVALDLVRGAVPVHEDKGNDGWLYREAWRIKGNKLIHGKHADVIWHHSLHTDGFQLCSCNRPFHAYMLDGDRPLAMRPAYKRGTFRPPGRTLLDVVPPEIGVLLAKIAGHCGEHKTLRDIPLEER